jgi:hypothetical protein
VYQSCFLWKAASADTSASNFNLQVSKKWQV